MDHKKYKEWLLLAVEDELNSEEKLEMEQHLSGCLECKAEYEEYKKLKSFLSENTDPEPDERLLFEARQNLRKAIRIQRNKTSFGQRFAGILTSRKLQLVFGGAAFMLIGLLTGYLLFKPSFPITSAVPNSSVMFNSTKGTPINPEDSFSLAQNDVRISNIRFIDQDASDGQIEFIFDAVKPVRMKGNINDERIKNVLTYAMLNVENPGVRLNSINALRSENKSQVDNEVKSALVSVAKFDQNPGVRREAIKLLSKFNSDEDVKNTLLYVLMNDKISGNRIEAINSLMKAQKEGVKFNQDELSIFKEKMKADDNNYIRYQAKTVLQENK